MKGEHVSILICIISFYLENRGCPVKRNKTKQLNCKRTRFETFLYCTNIRNFGASIDFKGWKGQKTKLRQLPIAQYLTYFYLLFPEKGANKKYHAFGNSMSTFLGRLCVWSHVLHYPWIENSLKIVFLFRVPGYGYAHALNIVSLLILSSVQNLTV